MAGNSALGQEAAELVGGPGTHVWGRRLPVDSCRVLAGDPMAAIGAAAACFAVQSARYRFLQQLVGTDGRTGNGRRALYFNDYGADGQGIAGWVSDDGTLSFRVRAGDTTPTVTAMFDEMMSALGMYVCSIRWQWSEFTEAVAARHGFTQVSFDGHDVLCPSAATDGLLVKFTRPDRPTRPPSPELARETRALPVR
ncbi:MAG: hypothetical protein HOQ24_14795 [Mycobacteriaceae bacterium]|nr:hypothetical protein [Mycobacteriaceae bacterium]